MPGPAGRSGTGPYGGAEQSTPGGHVPPTVSDFRFSWADMHRSPHRIPAFRGADMHRSPHRIPAFRGGGYHPPAAPGTRPFVGAHSVRPRFCGCSRPPPTRKRWGRGPGYVPRGRRLCMGGRPRGRVEGKGILNPAGGREGRPYGGEGKGMPGPAGRSGTGPYGGGGTPRAGRPQGPPLRGRRKGDAGPGGLKERGRRIRRAGLGPAPTGYPPPGRERRCARPDTPGSPRKNRQSESGWIIGVRFLRAHSADKSAAALPQPTQHPSASRRAAALIPEAVEEMSPQKHLASPHTPILTCHF